MANTETAAVDTLKSRYYKYLDTLCQSNNIDIGDLKNSGDKCEQIELFFGGLPVLVGLKYFTRLRMLRLFGQEITSLRPLNDISETLEELWLCEGALKDIGGIETCRKLRQLYLYDCEIEDATHLGKLYGLETLWIMNNKIRDFSFLSTLLSLKVLKAGGSQFSDSAALSVAEWPLKLQHLDVGGNILTSLEKLFLITKCSIMRVLTLTSEDSKPSEFLRSEEQLAWIAFHFFYLERLNGDLISDKFSISYSNLANKELFDQQQKWLIAEKSFRGQSEKIQKIFEKIDEKLRLLVASLSKVMNTVSKREGRREIVVQYLRQAQNNLTRLKQLKKNCVLMEYCIHRLRNYLAPSWRLEGALKTMLPYELLEPELKTLEQILRFRSTKKEEIALKVHYALAFDDELFDADRGTVFDRSAVDHLIMVRFFENTVNAIIGSKTNLSVAIDKKLHSNLTAANTTSYADLRLALYFCDNCHRRGIQEDLHLPNPNTPEDESANPSAKELWTVNDVADILTPLDEKSGFIILPLFKQNNSRKRKESLRGGSRSEKSKPFAISAKVDEKADSLLQLCELDVAVLCVVEVNQLKQLQFCEFANFAAFDEQITRQIKKFKDVGIDVKMISNVNYDDAAIHAATVAAKSGATAANEEEGDAVDVLNGTKEQYSF